MNSPSLIRMLCLGFMLGMISGRSAHAVRGDREWTSAMEKFRTTAIEQEIEKKDAALSERMAEIRRHKEKLATAIEANSEMPRFLALTAMIFVSFGLVFYVMALLRRTAFPSLEAEPYADFPIAPPLAIADRATVVVKSYMVNADSITLTTLKDGLGTRNFDEITQTIMVPKTRKYLAQHDERGWRLHELDRHGRAADEVGQILVGSRVRGSVLGKPEAKSWYELKNDGDWTEVGECGQCVLSVKQVQKTKKSRSRFAS